MTRILIVSLRSCLFGTLSQMFSFKTRIVHFCLQAVWEWESCALLPYLAQTKPEELVLQLSPPILPPPGACWELVPSLRAEH